MTFLSSAAGIHEQSASGIIHGHTTRTPRKLMIHNKTSCQNSQTALVALGGKTRSQQQSRMEIIGGACPEQRERSMSTDIAGQEDAVHGESTLFSNDQATESAQVRQAARHAPMNNPQVGSFTVGQTFIDDDIANVAWFSETWTPIKARTYASAQTHRQQWLS
jgi:hypothetical protein